MPDRRADHPLELITAVLGLGGSSSPDAASIDSQGQSLEAIFSGTGEPADWDALQQYLVHHNVVPQFYARLKQAGFSSASGKNFTHLRESALTLGMRSQRLAGGLLEALDLLAAGNIPALPFKGAAMAIQAYGDLTMRQFLDIDLLIHGKDFHAANLLLIQAGFTPELPITPGRESWLLRANYHQRYSRLGEILEIHWAVAELSHIYPLSPEHWWQNLQPVEILGREVPALSPENNLWMACIHGASNQWQKLKWIADVAHLIQANPGLDWQGLLEQAERAGFRRVLLLGTELARQALGVKLPGAIEKDTAHDPRVQELVAHVQRSVLPELREFGMLSNNRFYLRARERLGDRLYYGFNQAFIPKQAEWQTSPWPDALYPLYYLIRPLRLAVKFARMRLLAPGDSKSL